jgi:hypothetical protein
MYWIGRDPPEEREKWQIALSFFTHSIPLLFVAIDTLWNKRVWTGFECAICNIFSVCYFVFYYYIVTKYSEKEQSIYPQINFKDETSWLYCAGVFVWSWIVSCMIWKGKTKWVLYKSPTDA